VIVYFSFVGFRDMTSGNWTFRPFVSSPLNDSPKIPPGRIQRFLLIELKPKHHRLDVFN